MFRARAFRKKHPRVESAPRDDRSSKNQPKRAENDRGAFEVGEFRTLFLPRLFAGRLAGHDGRAGAVAPFALEGEHSAAEHAASLRAVARAGDDWDFTWLLPGRGDAVRFESPAAARAALEAAADAAAAMAARGA